MVLRDRGQAHSTSQHSVEKEEEGKNGVGVEGCADLKEMS